MDEQTFAQTRECFRFVKILVPRTGGELICDRLHSCVTLHAINKTLTKGQRNKIHELPLRWKHTKIANQQPIETESIQQRHSQRNSHSHHGICRK
jgi:hypothetical protein